MRSILRALRALDRRGVRFVVIGEIGARLYGSPTVTGDTDICNERSLENLERFARALRDLGARRGFDEDVTFLLDAETPGVGKLDRGPDTHEAGGRTTEGPDRGRGALSAVRDEIDREPGADPG